MTTPTTPTGRRYLVALGPAGDRPPADAAAEAGAAVVAGTVAGWLADAEARAAEAHAAQRAGREDALEAARAAEDAASQAVADLGQEVAVRAEVQARRAALLDELKGAVSARRQAVVDLHAAAQDLAAATGEWLAIDDKRQATETALVALWDRAGGVGSDAVELHAVIADMVEAESVLGRADRRRASAVASADSRWQRARQSLEARQDELRAVVQRWWGADGELPQPLVGLLRLQDAEAQRSEERERRARAEALQAASAAVADLQDGPSSAAPPTLDPAAVVLERLIATATTGLLHIDDALTGLDDRSLRGVLDGLTGAAIPVSYLTADPRVLAWAIVLPPEVGSVTRAR